MKKNTFLLPALLILTLAAQATIRRVGYTGMPVSNIDFAYSDFSGAVNAAAWGDTIQVYQQSNTSWAPTVIINKKLYIYGFGHSLNVNSGNQVLTTADTNANFIYRLLLDPGSAGTTIQGLNVNGILVRDSNITIRRCKFFDQYLWTTDGSTNSICGTSTAYKTPYFSGSPYDDWWYNPGGLNFAPDSYNLKNITITGCYFAMGVGSYTCCGVRYWPSIRHYSGNYNVTNLMITNNYFNTPLDLKTTTTGQYNGLFANNIVNSRFQHLYNMRTWNSNNCSQGIFSNYNVGMVSSFDFFQIKNNIFNTDDTVTCPFTAPNCIAQNNIFSCAQAYACTTASSSNNIYKANMSQVFGPTWNNGMVYGDNQLSLGASSPAVNAGLRSDGSLTNCGVFGGEANQQYIQSGIPPAPSIYQYSTPGPNANTNPYTITISVKSNN